jgi:hypothetical protein
MDEDLNCFLTWKTTSNILKMEDGIFLQMEDNLNLLMEDDIIFF